LKEKYCKTTQFRWNWEILQHFCSWS